MARYGLLCGAVKCVAVQITVRCGSVPVHCNALPVLCGRELYTNNGRLLEFVKIIGTY